MHHALVIGIKPIDMYTAAARASSLKPQNLPCWWSVQNLNGSELLMEHRWRWAAVEVHFSQSGVWCTFKTWSIPSRSHFSASHKSECDVTVYVTQAKSKTMLMAICDAGYETVCSSSLSAWCLVGYSLVYLVLSHCAAGRFQNLQRCCRKTNSKRKLFQIIRLKTFILHTLEKCWTTDTRCFRSLVMGDPPLFG